MAKPTISDPPRLRCNRRLRNVVDTDPIDQDLRLAPLKSCNRSHSPLYPESFDVAQDRDLIDDFHGRLRSMILEEQQGRNGGLLKGHLYIADERANEQELQCWGRRTRVSKPPTDPIEHPPTRFYIGLTTATCLLRLPDHPSVNQPAGR